MNDFTSTRAISAQEEASLTNKICAFIAKHLNVDLDTISTDLHLRDDLGLDWLDVVELTVLLEEQFRSVADESDEIEFVGDLVCHIENGDRAGQEHKQRRITASNPLA